MADTDAPNPEAMVDEAPGPLRERIQRLIPESTRGRIALALSLVIVIGLPVLILLISPVDHPVATYAAVFILPLLATAFGFVLFFIPPAADAFIVWAGSRENVLLVGVLAGAGMALGDLSKFIAGGVVSAAAGGREFKLPGWLRRVWDGMVGFTKKWMDRYATLTLVVMAAIPLNPLVDIAFLSAGATGMPLQRFLGSAFVGRVIRCFILALIGTFIGQRV